MSNYCMRTNCSKHKSGGFTLVELIITIGILGIVLVGIMGALIYYFQAMASARARIVATSIANEKMEVIRNMPYDSLGTTTGWPPGNIPATQTLNRNGFAFTITTRIDYVDDPFDGNAAGTIPGKPIDTVPNDYKKAEVKVTWKGLASRPVILATVATPRNLESSADSGSLFIKVFNAAGLGVPQATVHVTNSSTTPPINITNTTDNDGNLQLLSLPPKLNSYHIEVTKDGYSSDATYAVDPVNLPNPIKPNVSVIVGLVTNTSFAIDITSSLTINTVNQTCQPLPNIPLSLWGAKLIGRNPDVHKYSSSPPTNANGILSLTSLEWDLYTLIETAAGYDIAGVIPPITLNILPNTSQNMTLVMAPHASNSLLVTAKDSGTKTALTSATVRLYKTGYDTSLLTGHGFFEQTDWSGGSGQELFSNQTKYSSDDGHVNNAGTAGEISLKKNVSTTSFSETFTTTNYKDEIATTANWNTAAGQLELPKNGSDYIPQATGQTIKLNTFGKKITKATLQSTHTLNGQTILYKLSANGGTNFETVTRGVEYTFLNPGTDLRLQIVLITNNSKKTPLVADVSITYTEEAYESSAQLISSTYDTGTASTFGSLTWLTSSQPPETGPDSVKIQIATNNDNATWNFIGPDGTANSFYATSGTALHSSHNNSRYIRYKIILSTAAVAFSPSVSQISIGYTSGCTAPGQAFFSNLTAATYNIDVSLTGYQPYTSTINVSGAMQKEILLTPL